MRSPSLPCRNEWFVRVALHGLARPDFYVVPRNVVAAYVHISHRSWLSVPAKNGKPHLENTVRNVEEQTVRFYRARWALLEQPAHTAPHWLSDWVFTWAKERGLPDGDPGLVRPLDGVMSPEAAAWLPCWMVAPSSRRALMHDPGRCRRRQGEHTFV